MTETIKTESTTETDNSFVERLVRNTISCYATFGIIALVIAVALGLCFVIGYSIIGIYNSVSVLPVWVQCAIVIALSPFVVAVFKTLIETETPIKTGCATNGNKPNPYARFEVTMIPTLYNWTDVFLYAHWGSSNSEIIAYKRPKNSEAKYVANELLLNADEIFAEYLTRPKGTITMVDPKHILCEPFPHEQINELKNRIKELEKNQKPSKDPVLPPLTNLERQTRKNNQQVDL